MPHGHSLAEGVAGGLPELANVDCTGSSFKVADVFSIISGGEDSDVPAPREAALDYDLWFVSIPAGGGPAVSVHGVVVTVFVPGWTLVTGIDDYVARWVPAPGIAIPLGGFNAIAIDPHGSDLGHDEITEIDAIKVAFEIPEPTTLTLLVMGGLLLARRGRWT